MLKVPKKMRTAEPQQNFTGSYKSKVYTVSLILEVGMKKRTARVQPKSKTFIISHERNEIIGDLPPSSLS